MPEVTVLRTILVPVEGTKENREAFEGEVVSLTADVAKRFERLGYVEPRKAPQRRGAAKRDS